MTLEGYLRDTLNDDLVLLRAGLVGVSHVEYFVMPTRYDSTKASFMLGDLIMTWKNRNVIPCSVQNKLPPCLYVPCANVLYKNTPDPLCQYPSYPDHQTGPPKQLP